MAIEIIYNIQDADGDEADTSVRIAGEPTLAGLNGFGAAFATALNNVIAGKVLGAFARLIANISALTGNLVGDDSDVEHIGKFEFRAPLNLRVKCNIPALAEVAVNATTSDSLSLSEPEVAAFITAMEDGIAVTGGTISPCDMGEGDITELVFAREAFRNSGARR